MSPSTTARDRGEKFFEYRAIPSLRDYLVVSQDVMHVEHYSRQAHNDWILDKPGDTIAITSIGCQLCLAEVYEQVQLPQRPERQEPR